MAERIQEDNAPVEPVAQPDAPGVAPSAAPAAPMPRIGAMVHQRLNRARAGR